MVSSFFYLSNPLICVFLLLFSLMLLFMYVILNVKSLPFLYGILYFNSSVII